MNGTVQSIVLEVPEMPSAKDSTLFIDADAKESAVERVIDHLPVSQRKSSKYSFDSSVVVESSDGNRRNARIIACRCFRGAKWSVTIRLEQSPPFMKGDLEGPNEDSHFALSNEREGFFCSLGETRDILYRETMEDSRRTGLVVIAGATASGKSEVARGMIYRYMEAAARNSGRRAHLITYEDPIEKFYVKGDAREARQPLRFDYTPREKGIDAADLRSVLRDALRQTPTLIFVGEIRDRTDWSALIDFAGAGHSVIATAHASSLAETWGKILSAVGARSPAQRSEVAERILAVIHLRTFPKSAINGSFPAFWRHTPSAAKALMAEGRGSLVPQRKGSATDHSSFGRVWFLEQFPDRPAEDLLKAAFTSDLEGI